MALYVKYQPFVGSLADAQINALGADHVFKAIIHSDDTAVSSSSVTSCSQLTPGGNGYTAGGTALTYTCALATGVTTFAPTSDITWTASGGNLGGATNGRYFSIYDDTPTTPIADPLMCKFDYGATFTVATGETMTLDFDTTLWTLQ